MSSSISPYAVLARTLKQRLDLIADRGWYERDAAAHLAALQEISMQLESVAAELPRPLPGELSHYLERRSYDKALAWITSQSPSRNAN